ncbi:MAG: NADH-quinone oxidoreductase subunit J [Acidobacteria bacterium]|nr:MAG: NADH-quinone oxidoreductase subunit J [Acidobacteriota bacterium]
MLALAHALPLAAASAAGVPFVLLALVAVATALAVVLHRNPVIEALFLVLHLMSIAGLFALLHAPFLAILQVLLYAGAVVVLIVFVIMLLRLEPESRGGPGLLPRLVAFALILIFVGLIARAVTGFPPTDIGPSGAAADGFGSARQVGEALFNRYFYPFEVISLALVAAMAGAVLLAKRRLEG